MPEISGGLFDGIIDGFIKEFGFDASKIDLDQAKIAVTAAANAVKPATSAPMNLDDRAIDAAAKFVIDYLDLRQNPPPLIVGDAAVAAAEAEELAWAAMTTQARQNRAATYIAENGGDPAKMHPLILWGISQVVWFVAKRLLDRWLSRNKE